MSEWISVDDRLPEIGTEALIRIPVCSHFNIENSTYKGDEVFVGAWCDRRGKGYSYTVTHWQPLPDPPNERGTNV